MAARKKPTNAPSRNPNRPMSDSEIARIAEAVRNAIDSNESAAPAKGKPKTWK
jgi:hypothetical protein